VADSPLFGGGHNGTLVFDDVYIISVVMSMSLAWVTNFKIEYEGLGHILRGRCEFECARAGGEVKADAEIERNGPTDCLTFM
jgi:hypothetical protein